MSTNSINQVIKIALLILFFNSSTVLANYQVQSSAVTLAKNTTRGNFRKIRLYSQGMQEIFSYFKENCKTEIEVGKILTCLRANSFIMARLERIQSLLSNVQAVVQSYPADLSGLQVGIETRIANVENGLTKTLATINQSSINFERKSKNELDKATQKAINAGVLNGKADSICTSFSKKVDLFNLDFQMLKSAGVKFPEYYKKYDELEQYVSRAELFKTVCPEKIDLGKSSTVLQKFLTMITFEKTIEYIKKQCEQVTDPSLKKICLRPGEKKVDLLYSLFALEKVLQL